MSTDYKYDAFISYRHGDKDEAFARDLLKDLEAAGYKVAIDERDFSAQKSFLDEMERCVIESRFTLAIISPRYFEKGNTEKEARIRVVLDMDKRQHCLIPLIIEDITRPIWMYELVGIDYTKANPLVQPFERIKGALGNPL